MRCIDADKLYPDCMTKNGTLAISQSQIANAPTVAPCYQTTSCLDCKNYDKENHNCPRYCEVIKEAIKSRPQGVWIETDNRWGLGAFQCNKCNQFSEHQTIFCPNCGAEMKGGAQE